MKVSKDYMLQARLGVYSSKALGLENTSDAGERIP